MDTREAILQRLLVILQGIPTQIGYDVHTVFRNRGELKEDKRPSIVLLDGVEDIRTRYDGRGRVFMSPTVMTLSPQIFVLLKPRPLPDNAGVGAELSTFRAAVIKAIAADKTLAQLCGSNGGIILNRTETDMQTGSTLEGQLRLDFAVDYVLDPSAL